MIRISKFKTVVAGMLIMASHVGAAQKTQKAEHFLTPNATTLIKEAASDTVNLTKTKVVDFFRDTVQSENRIVTGVDSAVVNKRAVVQEIKKNSDKDSIEIRSALTGEVITDKIRAIDSGLIKDRFNLKLFKSIYRKLGREVKNNPSTGLLSDLENAPKGSTVEQLYSGVDEKSIKELKSLLHDQFGWDKKLTALNVDSADLSKIEAKIEANEDYFVLREIKEGNIEIYANGKPLKMNRKGVFEVDSKFVSDDFSDIKRSDVRFTDKQLMLIYNNKVKTSASKILPNVDDLNPAEQWLIGARPNTLVEIGPKERHVIEKWLHINPQAPEKVQSKVQTKAAVVDSSTKKVESGASAAVVKDSAKDSGISTKSLEIGSKKDSLGVDSSKAGVGVKAKVLVEKFERLKPKGATVWGIAKHMIHQQTGHKATNKEIAILKNQLLKDNNLTEQSARRLAIGKKIKISPKSIAIVSSLSAGGVAATRLTSDK